MKVHVLAVPAREPVHRESVAEVTGARANAAFGGLEASVSEQVAECARRRSLRERAAVCADEEAIVWLCASADKRTSCSEVSSQLYRE